MKIKDYAFTMLTWKIGSGKTEQELRQLSCRG